MDGDDGRRTFGLFMLLVKFALAYGCESIMVTDSLLLFSCRMVRDWEARARNWGEGSSCNGLLDGEEFWADRSDSVRWG